MDKAGDIRSRIVEAGYIAVEQLIMVAKENIIGGSDDELAADRLKNAAATKKLAIFDAFEILAKIELEKQIIDGEEDVKGGEGNISSGWAERRAK